MRIAKKFSPGPPTHPTTWKVLVLDNQTDLGFEESCGGPPLRRPLTHLLLLFLEHFSSRPEESLGERSKCRSVGEKWKTLKTKIEATTVAFINQDRLLQHILEWNKSHIWHEGDMDIGHLPCDSDGHLASTPNVTGVAFGQTEQETFQPKFYA